MNSNEQKPLKSWLLSPEDLDKLAILRAWWSRALPRPSRAVLYVEHVASGTDLCRIICERDMEGVVAEHTGHRDLNVMRRYYRNGMVFKGNPAKEIGL
jgi:hypothetical protein